MDDLKSVPEVEAAAPAPTFANVIVPPLLQPGTSVKVSNNMRKKLVFKRDPELREISWESKQQRISAYICSFCRFLT